MAMAEILRVRQSRAKLQAWRAGLARTLMAAMKEGHGDGECVYCGSVMVMGRKGWRPARAWIGMLQGMVMVRDGGDENVGGGGGGGSEGRAENVLMAG